jgi:hypothetical protein
MFFFKLPIGPLVSFRAPYWSNGLVDLFQGLTFGELEAVLASCFKGFRTILTQVCLVTYSHRARRLTIVPYNKQYYLI